MDFVGAPRRKRKTNGKYFELSLQGRLDTYAANEPTVGPQLIALKWLGNVGTHESTVDKKELLDAFEITEHAIAEIIEERSKRIASLAKRLTKKHKK